MHFPLILRVCQQDSPEQNPREGGALVKKERKKIIIICKPKGWQPFLQNERVCKGQRERPAAGESFHPGSYYWLLTQTQLTPQLLSLSPPSFSFPLQPHTPHWSVIWQGSMRSILTGLSYVNEGNNTHAHSCLVDIYA